ncbi:MAG: hypothetical protein QG564_1830 [Campylobacterota bacterium]|nr:hypothetical protein [Campylobacterota bacterium]
MKFIVIFLFFWLYVLSQNAAHAKNMGEVYTDKNCFGFADIVYSIELNRDDGVKQKNLIKFINDSKMQPEVKTIIIKKIGFIYALPKNSKYSDGLKNEFCNRKRPIHFRKT